MEDCKISTKGSGRPRNGSDKVVESSRKGSDKIKGRQWKAVEG